MNELKYPKVVFKDKKLEVFIEEWLGMLGEYCDDSFYHRIFKQKKLFGFSGLEVKKQFGAFLSMIGIDASETCVLKNFNECDGSFLCSFKNK